METLMMHLSNGKVIDTFDDLEPYLKDNNLEYRNVRKIVRELFFWPVKQHYLDEQLESMTRKNEPIYRVEYNGKWVEDDQVH
jgi:hypothetical protein